MTLKKQSSQITLQAQQERENFQREKNNLLVMLQKVRQYFACWCYRIFDFIYFKILSWCLQEREKLVSLEGKLSELSEGQNFTNVPVAIKEVGGSYYYNSTLYDPQQSAPVFKQSTSHSGWVSMSLRRNPIIFILILCDSSDFCHHYSTYTLWRKGEEAAKKVLPTQVTAYLIRGASSSPPLTADPWDGRFLPRL